MADGRFFRESEFQCKCGRTTCTAPAVDPELIRRLDIIRERVHHALIVNSGVRCPVYNAMVGGAPNSAHLTGRAADIRCPDSGLRWRLLSANWGAGASPSPVFQRVGVGANFIHFDTIDDRGPVVWHYYSD
jgi:uncharacterized protein YcbK (DUF882 family)